MSIISRVQDGTLAVHELAWILILNLSGDVTDAQAVSALENLLGDTLTAGEIAQLTQVKAAYTGLSPVQKVAFVLKFEAAMQFLKRGVLTVAQFKTIMGIVTD